MAKNQYQLVTFFLNGKEVERMIDVRASLTDMLRNDFSMTSVKKGCEVGECGACNVLIDGECYNSCLYLAVWAEGKHITTLEGLMGPNGELSEGNCLLLSDGGVHLLLDAGISTRRIKAGLLQLGLTMADVDGVLITHEHSDHVSGLQTMVKHHRIPIYTSPGTARQLAYRIAGIESLLRPVEPGTVFSVGDCRVTVFRTSHDAAQSVDYRVDGSAAVGFLTDTGFVTPEAEAALAGVDTLVLESNHDVEWLRSGPYPYSLKARILGDEGHLSNDAAAEFAARMARCGTRCIILAHLSRENNTPQRAWDTVQRRLNTVEAEVLLEVAPRSEVSPPYGMEVPVCSE